MTQGLVLEGISPQRIGIFDSGVGGLTVLQELYRQLPNESILYFADTARLPYGNRTPEEILRYVREILTWMGGQGVKMVLMACNTSSALALEIVQKEFTFPILGLIWPGAKAAAQKGKRIGLIATPATVKSNAYRQAILEVNPTCQVWQVGCPDFVPLIEQNRIRDSHTYSVAERYLSPLKAAQIDTLIYGCTHYPHLAPVLTSILSSSPVNYVNPAIYMVSAATRELDALGIRSHTPAWSTVFAVTGSPGQFARTSVQWLGYKPQVNRVQLPVFSDYTSLGTSPEARLI